jgi:acetyl esterase
MASKYPIHKDFRFIPSINQRFSWFPIAATNALIKLSRIIQRTAVPGVEVFSRHIPGRTNPIRLKIFQPASRLENKKRPCLVYFHGGAFALTYVGPHLVTAAEYAHRLDAVVVFVEYTLTNQATFPAGFNDCYDATVWAFENADDLGVDNSCLAVGGDSAGGGMAATVAQKALDEKGPPLRGQLLIYPVIDRSCTTESVKKFRDTPIWTGVSNERMWKKYLENYADGEVPRYAAAADREDVAGLPPAYVELAEFDPLHDEGLAYAERLKDAGVNVEIFDTKGTIHGYDDIARKNPTSIEAMNRRIAFLQGCMNY